MTGRTSKKAILKARARALAQKLAAPATEETVAVVEFTLAGEHYGIETCHVREVFPFKELTVVPCTPIYFAGIVNVRGQMIAALDLRRFFELPADGLHDLHKVIILHSEELDLGILADDVASVHTVPVSQLQASLPTLTGIRARYLRGLTEAGLVVLDAGKLMKDERLTVDKEAS